MKSVNVCDLTDDELMQRKKNCITCIKFIQDGTFEMYVSRSEINSLLAKCRKNLKEISEEMKERSSN